jgi:hypothetical protein
MSQLLASPVAAPARRRLTTAQTLHQAATPSAGASAAPTGFSLHQFTELLDHHLDLTALELHRTTTILTKQIRQALGGPAKFRSIRALVTDPDRIATVDGQSALELCGFAWHQIRSQAADRADAALDGAEQFGEGTVLLLAALRAAQCHMPWWGTQQWETRVDDWSRTIRFASGLKHTVRCSPELVADDVLHEIITG